MPLNETPPHENFLRAPLFRSCMHMATERNTAARMNSDKLTETNS